MLALLRPLATRLGLALAVVLGRAAPARAASYGPPMPWDGPLQIILASLAGTVAHVLITVAGIVTGLVFAFSEHGSGRPRPLRLGCRAALPLPAPTLRTPAGRHGRPL